jgi:uncharacterized damage-inducible protein DinB
MNDALIQELEREAQTTRRVLERVPDDKLGWKPHDKSMSLGQLALHVATVPGNVAQIVAESPFELPDTTQTEATSASELIPALDESVSKAKGILSELDEAAMESIWSLRKGDRELLAAPRGTVLRSIMLNHWYHHRGQLSVYLRLLDVPVPSIYGPSADENPFG